MRDDLPRDIIDEQLIGALHLRALTLAGFERSWLYSDAASDLPLLHAVTDPVAVRPDAALRDHAQRAGWPVIAD